MHSNRRKLAVGRTVRREAVRNYCVQLQPSLAAELDKAVRDGYAESRSHLLRLAARQFLRALESAL